MKILVTGGLGAVGKPLAEELKKRGNEVWVADRTHHHEPNYIRCDVGEFRQVENLFSSNQFDFVYHLAAEFGRRNGEDHYENLWRTNAVGTKNLIRMQERLKFKMIFTSSSEVYGDYRHVMNEDVMDNVAIKQMITLFLLAAVVSSAVNLVSPNRIDFIGQYRDLSSGNGPIVPPAAQQGDPPFIDINVAQLEFSYGTSLFIDATDPEEYECGTIPGSVNIPFERLPDNLAAYFDSALQHVARDYPLIVFCTGEECDLSLHLARNLQSLGYSAVSIFFGGAREWEKFGLEMQRRRRCEQ